MKIKRISACLLAALLIVFAFNIGWNIKDAFFDNIDVLPKGKFLYSSLSPNGETTVSLYKVSMSDNVAVRAAVVNLQEDGSKTEHNIFWELGADNAIVGWVSNNVISINEKLIDVTTNEVYDSRYDKSDLEKLD